MRPILAVAVLVAALAPSAHAGPGAPVIAGPDVPTLLPATAVVRVFTDEAFSCAQQHDRRRTIAVPQGDWNRIVLQFTVRPDGDPWDRLFGVSIGGVEVLRGTTPRTEMTLRKDITEYAPLLPSGGTAEVRLVSGSFVGRLLESVTLEFYVGEITADLVAGPFTHTVGAIDQRTLNGAGSSVAAEVDLPDEPATQAFAELTVSNHGNAEAELNGTNFHILSDGVEIATVRPVPYLYAVLGFGNDNANTACAGPGTSAFGDTVHPVMWWTAQRALDEAGVHLGVGEIPPYRASIDPALVTGHRTLEVRQVGGVPYWPASLSVLLR